LAEDIKSKCFSSEQDLIDQLKQIIDDKRSELGDGTTSAETDELNEFLGFCAGCICDGRVLEAEVRAILAKFRSSPILMQASPFSTLKRTIETAMADDVLTEDEALDIKEWIAQLMGDGFIDTGITNIGNVAKLDEPITDPSQI
jgi:hypothetical protein